MDVDIPIQCPYDKSHRILPSRMAIHLVKCKRNHRGMNYLTCDYNTTHKIPKAELQNHHQTCPDRRVIEFVKLVDDEARNSFPVQSKNVKCEASWNDNSGTYNPKEHCTKNEIITHKDVASESERRNFRHNERRRINTLLNPSTNNTPPGFSVENKENCNNSNTPRKKKQASSNAKSQPAAGISPSIASVSSNAPNTNDQRNEPLTDARNRQPDAGTDESTEPWQSTGAIKKKKAKKLSKVKQSSRDRNGESNSDSGTSSR